MSGLAFTPSLKWLWLLAIAMLPLLSGCVGIESKLNGRWRGTKAATNEQVEFEFRRDGWLLAYYDGDSRRFRWTKLNEDSRQTTLEVKANDSTFTAKATHDGTQSCTLEMGNNKFYLFRSGGAVAGRTKNYMLQYLLITICVLVGVAILCASSRRQDEPPDVVEARRRAPKEHLGVQI
jgi:hypothetical protein